MPTPLNSGAGAPFGEETVAGSVAEGTNQSQNRHTGHRGELAFLHNNTPSANVRDDDTVSTFNRVISVTVSTVIETLIVK